MDLRDSAKIAFITDWGVFAYKKMPFGLKYTGTTYQQLVDRVFRWQIGRNLEVYVDDIMIKSKTRTDFPQDVDETLLTF